jgi:HAE1 family hydrophobic/amphiphilic exporter-1
MAAVFFPVGFMEGPTGVFYRQFAFTLATAILISAMNALTLSPALCALFLKNPHNGEGSPGARRGWAGRFFAGFNAGFAASSQRYIRGVRFLTKNRWLAVGLLLLIIAGAAWLMKTAPKGFIPNEDDNFVVFMAALPPGASLDRTTHVLRRADTVLQGEHAIHSTVTFSGFNMLSNSSGSAYAMGFVNLKPIKDRGPVSDINQVVAHLSDKFSPITEGNFSVFTMPTVPGFGAFNGLEFVLQDRTGGSIHKFSDMAQGFLAELMKQKEIGYAFTLFKADYPQLEMVVDDIKAKQLGVSIKDLMTTMQAYYGSMQAADFNRFGKYYRVFVQADMGYRADPASLEGIYVRNQQGEMVPVNTLVKLEHVYGPESIDRYNMFNSISVNATPKPGFSTGDAMRAVEATAARYLPQGYSYEWTGLSKEESESGNQMLLIFAMSILFVYFLLSAQYESYILPLCVILSIPTGVAGVFLAIRLAGIDNNIYVQVGLIMLIGLLAKNAILIVEFALQRRRAGQTLVNSALEAAKLRLRPILMTSFAFIAGLIPLMYVKGGSAMGNHSISIGTAGGMLSGVMLGIFIVPVLFVMLQYVQEKFKKPVQKPALTAKTGEIVV